MKKPTDIMQAALDHSFQRCEELERNSASGWVDTEFGRVQVNIVIADGRATIRNRQFRKTWELNGKRISAAKLQLTLST